MLDIARRLAAERDHADRAASRLRRDRDARRALAGVGAVDRRRGGDALHAPDARLLPLVRAAALVGDRDGDAARGGELPALGDRGVGSGERGGVDVLPRRSRRGAAAPRLLRVPRRGPRGRAGRPRPSSSAFSSTSRRSACPSSDDRELAWERFCRRRAEYEPILDALARLVDAPAGSLAGRFPRGLSELLG